LSDTLFFVVTGGQMQTATANEERVMAKAKGRPKTSQRNDATAKVDKGILKKAKFVADSRDIPLAEYLSDVLRAPVDRDFAKAARQASEGETGG
jgi:hypothetical protein